MKVKKRKYLRSGRLAAPDFKFTGEEPEWKNSKNLDTTFNKALNFYNYYLDRDDYIHIICEYMKSQGYNKDEIKLIESVPKSNSDVAITGKICRCFNVGMPAEFRDYSTYVKNNISSIMSDAKEHTYQKKYDTTQKVKPNVHRIMREKVRKGVLFEIESVFDEWCANPKVKIKKISISSILRAENVPVSFIGPVADLIKAQKEEFDLAYNKECDQCVEGYSYLTKVQLRKRIEVCDDMLNELVLYKSAKKATRKPRIKKPKSAEKQVSRIKYLPESKEYSVCSCDPVRVIGSETLIIFNTKYRRMTMFKSQGRNGLTVKGTTIQDFDEKSSYSLTLRKPQISKLLPILVSKTEKQIEKEINLIKTKRKPAKGRCNKDTVLLRTI